MKQPNQVSFTEMAPHPTLGFTKVNWAQSLDRIENAYRRADKSAECFSSRAKRRVVRDVLQGVNHLSEQDTCAFVAESLASSAGRRRTRNQVFAKNRYATEASLLVAT
jgi:ribosomal protein S8